MVFTLEGYEDFLDLLDEKGYTVADYFDWKKTDRCVVLRHDIDTDLQQALSMSEIEYKHGVKSTYFVLLTSDFYNLHSYRNKNVLNKIRNMGHSIGLHFDEMAYPKDAGNINNVIEVIKQELHILSEILSEEILVFSYHRPTKIILDANIEIQGIVNAYGNEFFRRFKYLSDSRAHWKEPVLDIIRDGRYSRLQILTHPLWYREKEMSIGETLKEFIHSAKAERYQFVDENISGLSDIIEWEDIL